MHSIWRNELRENQSQMLALMKNFNEHEGDFNNQYNYGENEVLAANAAS